METQSTTQPAATPAASVAAMASAASGQGSVSTPVAAETSSPWSSLKPEHQAVVQNKGFKDVDSVVQSFVNLEKLMGVPAEQLARLPKDMKNFDEMLPVYKQLGLPDKPEDYGFTAESEEGKEFTNWLNKTMHESGMTRYQAERFHERWNQGLKAREEATLSQYTQKIEQETSGLKTEWGAAYDQNMDLAKRAAKEFGISAEAISALEGSLGFAGVMKVMQHIGSKVSEAAFHSSGNASSHNGILTPAQARYAIDQKMQDSDFSKRYANGDSSAKAEMDRLHAMLTAG